MTINCDNHAGRAAEYKLCSVTNPRAIVRNLCLECRNAHYAATSTSPREMARSGEPVWEMYGGRAGYTEHAYHNPNAVYHRAQAQHTLDRSEE